MIEGDCKGHRCCGRRGNSSCGLTNRHVVYGDLILIVDRDRPLALRVENGRVDSRIAQIHKEVFHKFNSRIIRDRHIDCLGCLTRRKREGSAVRRIILRIHGRAVACCIIHINRLTRQDRLVQRYGKGGCPPLGSGLIIDEDAVGIPVIIDCTHTSGPGGAAPIKIAQDQVKGLRNFYQGILENAYIQALGRAVTRVKGHRGHGYGHIIASGYR